MKHLIGIGGIGMSALAKILHEKGESVSGSDVSAGAMVKALRARGLTINTPHNATSICEGMELITSTAIKGDNCELKQGRELGLKVTHRAQALIDVFSEKKGLYVTGSHGKTSTSSLLAHLLVELKSDPSYALGGIPLSLQDNGRFGTGPYFAYEADESDGSMMAGTPYGAIVTSLEPDHLDYWGDFKTLKEAMHTFCQKPEILIVNGDDPLLAGRGIEIRDRDIIDFAQEGKTATFRFAIDETLTSQLSLQVIGFHQVKNALAVYRLLLELGFDAAAIEKGFETFKGVKRRGEYLGEQDGAIFYDDYAHHPTEVEAILKSLKQAYSTRRLIAVFEPHRVSRFNDFCQDFLTAFSHADATIVTDIYRAGETLIPEMTPIEFAKEIKGEYAPFETLEGALKRLVAPGDLVVTLGAGTITQVLRRSLVKESSLT